MTAAVPDMANISQRLSSLEEQLRQLRGLLAGQPSPVKNEVATEHPYITRQPTNLRNEPTIRGTRTPVRAIVEHWKFGDTPETIVRKLPYLRLAQVFDALSYYDDHRAEIEQYIAANRVPVDD
jgi:uncharacterized protein (DUF433 family)